jgi:dCTP deaminase
MTCISQVDIKGDVPSVPCSREQSQIASEVHRGLITIDPFVIAQINPNSYNYRLGSILRTVEDTEIDTAKHQNSRMLEIPTEGIVLQPGRVYLGTTVERIGSHNFVPLLIGRSSLGRLGVFLQVAADLGQLGAIHCWTLEIVVAQSIRLYAGMIVGQVSFWQPTGAILGYKGQLGRCSEPMLPETGWLDLPFLEEGA